MNQTNNILFFFLIYSNLFGQQNIILNGDFEEYWECPQNLTEIEKCKFVYNPCYNEPPQWSSTSDYFNRCAISGADCGVPFNVFGYQQPKSGDGYLGLIHSQSFGNYKEYIQLSFSEELKPYATYQFSIYVSISDAIGWSSDFLHFKFVNDLQYYSTYLSDVMIPDVELSNLNIVDSSEWLELNFNYVAQGNERYIIIGNFNIQSSNDCFYVFDGTNPFSGDQAYLLFDNASLHLIKEADPISFSNVFTPNGDGKNDLFELLSGEGHTSSITIINRWGNIVYNSDSIFKWNGTDNSGLNHSEGVYFVSVISKIEKNGKKEHYYGMVHLIR